MLKSRIFRYDGYIPIVPSHFSANLPSFWTMLINHATLLPMTMLHPTWQHALKNAVTEITELCSLLNIPVEAVSAQAHDFPLRVPREFVALMEKGNPKDPLLLQVLPQSIERQSFPGFSQHPLGEQAVSPVPGLLHKYDSRVLLTLTAGCAVHCRYCFRRHFPYQDHLPSADNFQRALAYIQENIGVEEVILSGGDPLILKDDLLMHFIRQLENVPHLSRLRIHTRVPIVIPDRLKTPITKQLTETRFQVILVVHANHPNEISTAVCHVLQSAKASGITLLNQSVLLKDVNDNADCLALLSKKLFTAGVL